MKSISSKYSAQGKIIPPENSKRFVLFELVKKSKKEKMKSKFFGVYKEGICYYKVILK